MTTNADLIAEARSPAHDCRCPYIKPLADALEAAEAELQGLREIATSGPSTASGPSPLSHRAVPMEDTRP